MTITLTVDSYYEYFLTLLGWIISNNTWELLTNTGLFALPFLFQLIALFIKVREQGDDEGNKGKLLMAWMENYFYLSIFMIFVTCIPLFSVNYATLEFDNSMSKQCGRPVLSQADAQRSKMASISSELNEKTAKLPLWWAFTYTVGKGVTHGFIASIPCKPDLRQLRFEVQNTQIESPTLRQEILDFVQQCYIPARTKVKQEAQTIGPKTARDLDWIGSKTLVNNGYYAKFRSTLPRPQWPYDPVRDAALPNTGKGGFPNCVNWWSDPTIGLHDRILSVISPSFWVRFQNILASDEDAQERILRALVRPENIAVSDGRVYGSYGLERKFDSQDLGSSVADAGMSLLGGAGVGMANLLTAPGFDAMRRALPMIQSILSLALIVSIPVLTVIGRYQIKTVITLTFAQFAIFFLSFWWELATWLDMWTFEALYGKAHNSWNLYGLQNQMDDWILNLVMLVMFLVLPTVWVGLMGAAGVQAGNYIRDAINKGTEPAQHAGDKATSHVTSAGTRKL